MQGKNAYRYSLNYIIMKSYYRIIKFRKHILNISFIVAYILHLLQRTWKDNRRSPVKKKTESCKRNPSTKCMKGKCVQHKHGEKEVKGGVAVQRVP